MMQIIACCIIFMKVNLLPFPSEIKLEKPRQIQAVSSLEFKIKHSTQATAFLQIIKFDVDQLSQYEFFTIFISNK